MAILQVLEGLSSETDCSIFSVEDHGETDLPSHILGQSQSLFGRYTDDSQIPSKSFAFLFYSPLGIFELPLIWRME